MPVRSRRSRRSLLADVYTRIWFITLIFGLLIFAMLILLLLLALHTSSLNQTSLDSATPLSPAATSTPDLPKQADGPYTYQPNPADPTSQQLLAIEGVVTRLSPDDLTVARQGQTALIPLTDQTTYHTFAADQGLLVPAPNPVIQVGTVISYAPASHSIIILNQP